MKDNQEDNPEDTPEEVQGLLDLFPEIDLQAIEADRAAANSALEYTSAPPMTSIAFYPNVRIEKGGRLDSTIEIPYTTCLNLTKEPDPYEGAILIEVTNVNTGEAEDFWLPKKLCCNLTMAPQQGAGSVRCWDKFIIDNKPNLLTMIGWTEEGEEDTTPLPLDFTPDRGFF